MPELPEVETSRLYVEEYCLGSTIKKVIPTEQGGGPREGLFDDIVIGEGVTAESLKSALEGRRIVELRRRGKQMWFVLDTPPHPLFHFGMTGAFTVKGEKRHKFVKFKVSEEWPPRFAKLELQMSNGTCLALTDPRRLARVRLREEPESSPPISLLGPDPVTHPLSLEVFAAALATPTAPIKAVLLAQDRVVSGVGNWIADEVCFQAHVHPGATCNTLAPEQVAALHTKLLSVCREACEARADYTAFPVDWLFHHRWNKGKKSEGAPRVSSGDPILFDVIGGRTTAIVPAVQKKGLLVPFRCGTGGKSGQSSVPAKAKDDTGGDEGNGKDKGKGKAKDGIATPVINKSEELEEKVLGQRAKKAKAVTGKTAVQPRGRAGRKSKEVKATRKKNSDGPMEVSGGGKKSRRSDKAGTVSQEVKTELVVATDSGKTKVTKAVSRKSGRGKTTVVEVNKTVTSLVTAPAKRGRGQEEGGGTAAAKGKRAKKAVHAVAKLEEVTTVVAKRVGSRRSSRFSR